MESVSGKKSGSLQTRIPHRMTYVDSSLGLPAYSDFQKESNTLYKHTKLTFCHKHENITLCGANIV